MLIGARWQQGDDFIAKLEATLTPTHASRPASPSGGRMYHINCKVFPIIIVGDLFSGAMCFSRFPLHVLPV
jgi:hypothetical protein